MTKHFSDAMWVKIQRKSGSKVCVIQHRTRREFEDILSRIKKASSLVENLNGRIRSYMDLKRTVPKDYFVLLKVYFNTRKYRRSRIASRIGKSPIELMTGKQYPEFLEALGY